jgi:hypothetical protein
LPLAAATIRLRGERDARELNHGFQSIEDVGTTASVSLGLIVELRAARSP